MRRFAPLSRVVLIALGLATPALGGASVPAHCGLVLGEHDVQLSADGISVVMQAGTLPEQQRRQLLARRAQLLGSGARTRQRCQRSYRYVRSVLERLTRVGGLEPLHRLDPPLELVLQCDDELPLPVAQALAGNVLLVPRALPLLAASEDALAAVLAHEVAHFSLQHSQRFQRASVAAGRPDVARQLVLAHESEADITGLEILARAGYDPSAAIDHLEAVSALYAARQLRAAVPRRHDQDGVRTARLRSQIDACGYSFRGRRTPIPTSIVAELRKVAD